MNELAQLQNINAVEVFKSGGTSQIYSAIEKEALSLIPDTTTDKGRKEIASTANNVAKAKVAIDNAGKALVADVKAQVKAVDAERKISRDKLDELKIKVRKPLTDWEAERDAKIEAEEARLKQEQEKERLAEVARIEAIHQEQEKARLELEAREAELKAKEDALNLKAQQAKQAEDQKIREAQIAQEAKERAEFNAQQAIIAEKHRVELEEKQKQDAIKAREADVAHRSSINTNAMNQLMKLCNINEMQAKSVIINVFNKNIPNVSINY